MESIAKDAQVIDNACDELMHSNRLRQLLGIILQFGNRLNTAGDGSKKRAGAFSLESLSKLSQTKAFDKKTTFLQYIVLIVQRNNELLLQYYDDIPTVFEAENVFWDQCQQDLEEVENQLENVRRISLYEARGNLGSSAQGLSDDDSIGDMELTLEEEVVSLRATPTGLFALHAIKQVSALREKIERTKSKSFKMKEYFGITREETEPQEIFSVFIKFTDDFKKAKEQVFSTAHRRLREDRKKARQQTPTKSKSKSLPSMNDKRSLAGKPLLRASSHQPNMNALFTDIQKRQPSSDASRDGNDGESSRSDLLNMIKGNKQSNMNTPSAGTSLLSSIKERQSPSESSSFVEQGQLPSSGGNPTGNLLDSIKTRHASSENVMATSNGNNNASTLDKKLRNENEVGSKQPSVSTASTQYSSHGVSRAGSVRDSMRQKALRRHRSHNNYASQGSSNTAESNPSPSQQASPNTVSTRSPREAMRMHERRRLAEAARSRNTSQASASQDMQ